MRNYVPIPEFTSVSFTNGKVDHGCQYFTLVLVIFLNVVTGFDIHLHVYGAISSALCHCFEFKSFISCVVFMLSSWYRQNHNVYETR